MTEELLRVSDGKLYDLNDMVRVGCNDCEGCFSCCTGMGESIVLDPFDIWTLSRNLDRSFQELLENELELSNQDGLVLPSIKMAGSKEACSFLGENGRCSIHAFRPGICRLFPLGRNYEDDIMRYFILKDACPRPNKTKVKVEKWVALGDPKKHHEFLIKWHQITKQFRIELQGYDEEEGKKLTLVFLNLFYFKPYEGDFFEEFYSRAAMLV